MKQDNHFAANIRFRSIENGVLVTTNLIPAKGPQRISGEVYYPDAASALADLMVFIPTLESEAEKIRDEEVAKIAARGKAKP